VKRRAPLNLPRVAAAPDVSPAGFARDERRHREGMRRQLAT
jgi:hypothetical protein